MSVSCLMYNIIFYKNLEIIFHQMYFEIWHEEISQIYVHK